MQYASNWHLFLTVFCIQICQCTHCCYLPLLCAELKTIALPYSQIPMLLDHDSLRYDFRCCALADVSSNCEFVRPIKEKNANYYVISDAGADSIGLCGMLDQNTAGWEIIEPASCFALYVSSDPGLQVCHSISCICACFSDWCQIRDQFAFSVLQAAGHADRFSYEHLRDSDKLEIARQWQCSTPQKKDVSWAYML